MPFYFMERFNTAVHKINSSKFLSPDKLNFVLIITPKLGLVCFYSQEGQYWVLKTLLTQSVINPVYTCND